MPSYLERLLPSVFAYANPDSFVNRVRLRRAALLRDCIARTPVAGRPVRILDIGGTHAFWRNAGLPDPARVHVTLLNIEREELPGDAAGFVSVRGDAMQLDYRPGDFDLIFSNSVIEHMGSREGQRRMAAEVRRVAPRYVVQTPAFWFPFEPHSHIPCFQFLPHWFRAVLIRHFRINYFPAGQTYAECRRVSRTTLMLTERQMRELFPGAQMHKERLAGLVKSYTAIAGFDRDAG